MASAQQATARTSFGASTVASASSVGHKGVSSSGRSQKNVPFVSRKASWGFSSAFRKGGASVQAAATATADITELERLKEENAALRKVAADAIKTLEESKRIEFEEEHAKLQAVAQAVGEPIPAVVAGAVIEAAIPVAREESKAAHHNEPVVPAPVAAAEPKAIVMEDAGVSAVVEVEREGTLVFKFSDSKTPAVSNASRASAMSVNPSPSDGKKTTTRKKRASKTSAQKTDGDGDEPQVEESKGAFVYRFDSASTTSASTAVSNATPTEEEEEAAAAKKRTTKTRSTTAGTTKRRTAKSDDAPAATKATKVDTFAAAKAAANKEVASHDPQAAIKDKEHWLYLTVPSTPVAGAECMFYFNKAQSEPLRHCNRIQLHSRFNNWEVDPEDGDRIDMKNASGIAGADGVDFWCAKINIPNDAYELNFIFSDGESNYDSNNQENYLMPVTGAMTKELWLDQAPERAEAAYLKRKEEERIAAEKAEAERKAAAEAQDAVDAQRAVDELRNAYDGWRGGAVTEQLAGEGKTLWKLKSPLSAGGKSTLLYNRTAGPLGSIPIPDDQSLVLKAGYNGWRSSTDTTMKRTKVAGASTGDDWWEAPVDAAEEAAVINFVVNYYDHYDNNNSADHKILVGLPSTAKTVESWAEALKATLLTKIRAAREKAEAEEAEKIRRREAERQAARDKAMEVRRAQMKHVLYTVPEVIEAGKPVTLHYNPNNTVLNGRQSVFLRGSFNRWKHAKQYGPIEMTRPTTGEHFTATIDVPKDAYSLDFVFSESAEGGQFDNRDGLDYHFDCKGAVTHEPQLHVCHIAVEMAPIAKVGGLGDVVTSLGRAVQEQGHLVEVILPRYDFFLQSPLLGATQYETEFDYNGTRVFVSTCVVEDLRCFFIEPQNGMFATSTVYQGASDAAKFEYFCRCALEFLLRSGRQPDILHCHDWSSADVAKFYWNEWHQYGLYKPKVVFTIHNLNYGQVKLGEAAYFSQRFTTVSPSYAWEIGGNPVVAPNSAKLLGIRNGIDIDIWDPETDIFLPVSYTADNVVEGKRKAREELRRRLGLTDWGDKPMVGVVTRLTKQKGTHLIAHACYRTMDRGGQYVLLGSAPDPKVQAEFNGLAGQYGGDCAAFCFSFDEPLSHLIYAASDFILVPSMFEPCGLTQMIAMRYGAIPVVRATGGLKDTVFDVDNDKARAAWELLGSTNPEDGDQAVNGFAFDGTDEGALDYALNRALDAYYNDKSWIHSLQERVMRQDWSWNKPAIDYIEMYWSCLK